MIPLDIEGADSLVHAFNWTAAGVLTFNGFLEMGGLLLCSFLLQQGSFFLCLHLQCNVLNSSFASVYGSQRCLMPSCHIL